MREEDADIEPAGRRVRLTPQAEYLHDIPKVQGIRAMLGGFTGHIIDFQPGSWATHVAGHPPGAFLVFVLLDRIGLPGGVPAASLCILVGATAPVSVAYALKVLGAHPFYRSVIVVGALMGMISSLLGLFQSAAEQIQKERQAAVETKRFVVLRVIVGGTLLTLLLTGLGVIVVARSVTKPMSSLAQAALEIGESRYAVFPDADRQDEVGVLSRGMEEMQRRLVSAERLAGLTRIATSIAHDLRTPLLGIEQGLQGLQFFTDSQLSGEARLLVGDLHVGARLAVGIVQDILDLYRQAYGELPLSYTQFRLDQVVREVVDLLKPEIADRRLEITLSAPPSEITADQRRLYRVLVNLLDNAVKNSPSGGNVRIIVSVRGEGSARRAVVAVEDEGKGLDPAALDTLFEPNRPVTSPTRMGTGLGLYLCRSVIASHRGTIWAENRSEGGARFVFDIPAEVMHVDSTADRGRSTSVQAESAHRP